MISQHIFGHMPDGTKVLAYTLRSETGLKATLVEYGATLQSLILPNGQDIVLGFDNLERYLQPHPCFGAAIGRVAGRIKQAEFTIKGQLFNLPKNDGAHNLHGGPQGFDKALWQGHVENNDSDQERLILTHICPDGHQGFPGQVTVQMIFSLHQDSLSLDMHAQSTVVTPINLTHHSYFNLSNSGSAPIDDHRLEIFCDHYLETDAANIPTGQIKSTKHSDFDYAAPREIARDLDDCFVKHDRIDNAPMKKLARLSSLTTGHRLIICSTQPALQAYSGGHMGHHIGKAGIAYDNYHGLSLEPQNFPNAINEQGFPDCLLHPNTPYHQKIRYTLRHNL